MEIKLRYPQKQKLADKIGQLLSNAADSLLFHIPLHELGSKWDIPRDEMISVFIQGVYDGVFTMEWIFHCPTCGSIAHETLSIHQASSHNFCSACNRSFANTLDDNIEVCFSIHPQMKVLDPFLKQQYQKKIEEEVMNGNYKTWITPAAIRGSEIVQNNTYRELMGSEVLVADQSLQMMKTAILFTDIKGSTQLYSDLGDAKAFNLVKQHFQILFDTIKEFQGVPVKTIGDAVMGAFIDSKKAVDAAIKVQQRLMQYYKDRPQNEHIEIKIGIHCGPTLVVTLNNRLDYFGSTVNLAARIQNIALPNEVVISEDLYQDAQVKKSIRSVTKRVQKQHAAFKGITGECVVYHVKVRSA